MKQQVKDTCIGVQQAACFLKGDLATRQSVVIKLTVCSYVNQQGFFCLWKRGETASRELMLTAAVTEHSEEHAACF